MINHARTLLLNRPASYFNGVAMSEYIDPLFKPVDLPVGLQAFRDILFTPGIDKFSENYIAAKLMQLLHAPELVDYTLAYDPRFTYDIGDDTVRALIESPVQIVASKNSDCDIVPKYRLNYDVSTRAPSTTGAHDWTFSTGTDDVTRMVYSRSSAGVQEILMTNGTNISNAVSLLGGFIRVNFELPSLILTGRYSIKYSALLPPFYDLAKVNRAAQLYVVQPRNRVSVFDSVGEYADNIDDLRFVWQNTPEFVLSLGAIVSAYIARIESLRINATTASISSSE